MSLKKFRSQIIYILLFSKLAVIASVVLNYVQHKLLPFQAKELIIIILPLFIVYLTVIFSSSRIMREDVKVNLEKPIVLFCKWIPIAFATYMIVVITFQQTGTAEDSTSFSLVKDMIGAAEIIFGFYIGFIFQLLSKISFANNAKQDSLLITLEQLQLQLKDAKESGMPDLNKKSLREQLAKGKVKEVITSLTNLISTNAGVNDLLNQVIQLSSQYHKYTEQKRLNLIDDDIVANQVVRGLLQIIDEL